jgi:uncharacterized membrane protein YhaH (DUF805 family)
MNFGEAIASGFQNYATFTGRASRSEYWYWVLFATLVNIAANILDLGLFPDLPWSPIGNLVGLALLLPGVSVSARRLHDIDRTAWWLLLGLTGIGMIVLIYWDCVRGTEGDNRFGPDPLAGHRNPALAS